VAAPALTPPPPVSAPVEENPGSLYSAAESDFLFADNRARRVGDIVLVNIVETSKGKQKADTTTKKNSTINLGVQSMFGKGDTRATPLGPSFGLNGHVGPNPMLEAGSTSTLDSTGETKREGSVTATIAARVVSILPGGLMQVEGAREVKLNNENQIIVVRGLIRSKDIKPDNSVLSSYLADAHIEYYGEGTLGDKQRPGWMSRLLDNVWPF
jgi:flagellar L-ring protein FlgH